ncbi:5-formyltetrahydrofolate cyclo-ligase [Arthrobacter sp. zg-Y750]|uniref:5-formyltetrahydrofolate cyclo-ligase n=1 Tax=Arthrobacter sp. zg-Y750 TaxID=2894189 RepID=UPI001E35ECCB|nr:5-formyltetrahydrofolate cyclo-ligase [Arthrobacter sp. zg-Y750]MCC9176256.1 5-formyltetrahydrofolate cyclo-ligase [Arthrobacter sp. zg-Y750]
MRQLTKDQARQEFLQNRRGLTDAERTAAARGLAVRGLDGVCELLPAGATVACYLSVGTEPGTGLLLPSLHGAGFHVVAPVCEPGHQLSWCSWTPGIDMVPGIYPNLMEPAGPRYAAADLPGLDLVFVPALAADDAGGRMGKGGGYYDRFLAQLRADGNAAPAVAVVFEQEFVPAGTFETTPLDAAVDAVLTPAAWRKVPV